MDFTIVKGEGSDFTAVCDDVTPSKQTPAAEVVQPAGKRKSLPGNGPVGKPHGLDSIAAILPE